MTDNHLPRTLSLAVHELRTPVTVVAGYLRMLLKEQAGPLNDKQQRMLEEAERSCGRISALVSELSELGRLEGGEAFCDHMNRLDDCDAQRAAVDAFLREHGSRNARLAYVANGTAAAPTTMH